MEDGDHVVINIPKTRVFAKTSEEFIKKRSIKNILKRTMKIQSKPIPEELLRKYNFPSEKPLQVQCIAREELLLPYRMYTKQLAASKHKYKLGIKVAENYKILTTDMKKRLYVENPKDDVRAMTEIDTRFFDYINGRPLPDRVPLFKSFKVAVADLLRLKQEIGYRNDTILNIDVTYLQEAKQYEISLKRCAEQVRYFDDYISEDYFKSMAFLEKCEKLKMKVEKKVSELHNLATKQFTIMSRLMGLDYLYGLQQKYGRFLYYLSPPTWRAKNRDFAKSVEIEAKGFDLGHSSEEDTFNVVFEKMKRDCAENFIKPVIYFTHPHDLLNIFEGIEKQQLHHFDYVNHLAPPKKMLNEGAKCLKEKITLDSAAIMNTIKGFEKLLEFSNERCTQLETRFFAIVNGLFYESVGAPEVMKLFVHLEFCFERVFAEKPINMDIISMAKALEDCYMDYSKRLDALQSDSIKNAVKQCMETERRTFRKAKYAARELRSFYRLERELLISFAPVPTNLHGPQSTSVRSVVGRKCHKRDCSKLNVDKQKNLSEAEVEYLTLFTDWIEGEDTTKYLHRVDDE